MNGNEARSLQPASTRLRRTMRASMGCREGIRLFGGNSHAGCPHQHVKAPAPPT